LATKDHKIAGKRLPLSFAPVLWCCFAFRLELGLRNLYFSDLVTEDCGDNAKLGMSQLGWAVWPLSAGGKKFLKGQGSNKRQRMRKTCATIIICDFLLEYCF
jgi:hypothetical protein